MKAVDDLQTGLGNGRHQLLKEKKKKKVTFQKEKELQQVNN